MKGKSFFVATCSVIIFVFCISSLSLAAELWPKKDQQLCWYAYQADLDFPIPASVDPTGLVRLWVMHSGKNQALVHGSNTEPHDAVPPDGTQLANGNAIVYSDIILIHASSSGYGLDEVRGWLGTIELNPDTLNGYFRGVGINYNTLLSPSGENGYVNYDEVQTLIYDPDCAPE